MKFESVDISVEELDQLVEEAAAALSEEANRKLRALVNTIKTVTELLVVGNLTIEKLRRLLLGRRTTEKTRKVLGDDQKSKSEPKQRKRPVKGHGRNGAADYQSAPHVRIEHPTLKSKTAARSASRGRSTR